MVPTCHESVYQKWETITISLEAVRNDSARANPQNSIMLTLVTGTSRPVAPDLSIYSDGAAISGVSYRYSLRSLLPYVEIC